MTRYMLLGGGTAGHINPLLAVAEFIRATEPSSEILVVGTREGLESRLVPERGFSLHTIERLPMPRRLSRYALAFPGKFLRATREVRQLIRDSKTDVVVGFGGYASAPGYVAARREHVPFIIHEANAKPGLANKLAARKTPFVGVAFSSTPIHNATLVGMPLRPEIANLDLSHTKVAAREFFGLNPNKPTLLVTGGSQGARTLNTAINQTAEDITRSGWQILHIWGELSELSAQHHQNYALLPYCDRMDYAFASADLVISRAGAATVSEICALGLPSVLVPYPVGNGEQRVNAQDVVAAGGAMLVDDSRFNTEWILSELLPLLKDSERIQLMGELAASVGHRDGTEKLLALIQKAQEADATLKG